MSQVADFDALSDYDKAGLSLNAILRSVTSGRVRKADFEALMYASELAERAVIAAMPRERPEDWDDPDEVELSDFIAYYGDGLRNDEAFARHAAWLAQREQGGGRPINGERT